MRDANPIEQLRRRLVELGCPAKAVRRITRETAEHLDDLQQAALKQGLPPSDAAKQAEQQLGTPAKLAEQHIAVLRNSTWWGRHPILGFAVLPMMSYPILLIMFALSGGLLGLVVGSHDNWQDIYNNLFHHDKNSPYEFLIPGVFPYVIAWMRIAENVGVALLALLLCWLIRRASLGFKWTLIACSLTAVAVLFTRIDVYSNGVGHGGVSLGIYWIPNMLALAAASLPLLIAALAYVRLKRAAMHSDKISNF